MIWRYRECHFLHTLKCVIKDKFFFLYLNCSYLIWHIYFIYHVFFFFFFFKIILHVKGDCTFRWRPPKDTTTNMLNACAIWLSLFFSIRKRYETSQTDSYSVDCFWNKMSVRILSLLIQQQTAHCCRSLSCTFFF